MEAPKDHCVYFLKDSANHIIYCGITRDPERRTKEHRRRFPDLMFSIQVPNQEEKDARSIEKSYIHHFKLVELGENKNGNIVKQAPNPRRTKTGDYLKASAAAADARKAPRTKRVPKENPFSHKLFLDR